MKKTHDSLPRVKLLGRRRGRCEFVGQLGIPSELCIHSLNGTWPFLNAKSKSKSLSLRLSLCWVLNPNDDLILLLVDCGGKPQLSMWSGFLALQSFMKCWWKYERGRYLSCIYRFWKQSIFVFMSFDLSALCFYFKPYHVEKGTIFFVRILFCDALSGGMTHQCHNKTSTVMPQHHNNNASIIKCPNSFPCSTF